MSKLIDQLKKRRSIYALGKNVSLSESEIETLVKDVVRECPSGFNSQTSRVVILFGDASKRVWEITEETLKPMVPADAFQATKDKLASFAAGIGTILFFEDSAVVKGLQESFPAYADNFPIWSEQASGMAQLAVWTALAEQNIGANIQHYNPLIDDAVAKEWNIPSNWVLRTQMAFGSIEAPANPKEYIDNADRFRVIK